MGHSENGKTPWECKLHHSQRKYVFEILLYNIILWCKSHCERSFRGGHESICYGISLAAFHQGKHIVNTDIIRIVKRALQASSLNLYLCGFRCQTHCERMLNRNIKTQVWGHAWICLWLNMPGEFNEVRTRCERDVNEVRTWSNVLTCSTHRSLSLLWRFFSFLSLSYLFLTFFWTLF